MKIYMKPKEELPVIGCEIDYQILIKSNNTNDIDNLDGARVMYKKDNSNRVIFLQIDSGNGRAYRGLTISQAEEIIETLQSMVKIIKG